MLNFVKKYFTRYLSAKVVLMLDVLVSVAASVFALIIGLLTPYNPYISSKFLLCYLLVSVLAFITGAMIMKPHRNAIRHMGLRDIVRLTLTSFIKDIIIEVVALCIGQFTASIFLFIMFDFLCTMLALIGYRTVMIMVYEMARSRARVTANTTSVLIYDTGSKAVSLVTRLGHSQQYSVRGFISPTPVDKELKVNEKHVYYFDEYEDFRRFMKGMEIDAVLFAHESDAHKESDGLVKYCFTHDIKVLIAPSVDEVVGGKVMQNKVREVRIEDLLGREEIKLDMDVIKENFGGKVVMVTGAAGSIGSELVRQLATFGVKSLVLYDNAETPLHNLRLELEERFPDLDFVPVIGDVRLLPRLDYAFRQWRPQIVFHAAAYKHVPLMEENPCEAVLVNVVGSRNVADKCIEYGVEKMVMISTDKAVNPTNIMGCTKRLAEIYVQSLGLAIEHGEMEGRTRFVTTRFGNVLGSNGSVIPRFRDQIAKGGPVTVTHPDIMRFFMTIPEACRLVMQAATMSTGNQIFVFDMGKPVKIDSLARKMIELAGFKPDVDIKVTYTGLRPGEKLYEEVLSSTENTDPTSHGRIRVARVREYGYAEAKEGNYALEALSRQVQIDDMVKLMKSIVPEFKSRNSRFEMFDKQ